MNSTEVFATVWKLRFTELSREENGEGGDRGDLEEKREIQKGREQ